VQSAMSGWHSQCGIVGGFMWLYDDFVGNGLAAQYASAINNAVSSSGFTLSGPTNVFLNQSSTASALITITALNGFSGKVNLSISAAPKGVQVLVQGQGAQRAMKLRATSSASTGFTSVTVTGTSGTITQTLTFTLAVSAALGNTGTGTPIDLSSDFNVNGIYQDGATYSTGGLDGVGYSYSSKLLSTSRVFSGILFDLGAANGPDAVGCDGQSISTPASKFSGLMLFATGVQGNQPSQSFTVNYTDGTSSQFVQSFSDWFSPQKFPHESEAVAMAYRNFEDGTRDRRTFSLYTYRFALNPAKTVQSVVLPSNPNVVVLAATLLP
jgi:hypothetical protein